MKNKKIILYILLLVFVILSYIFTPFKEDQRGFFAASYYADLNKKPFPVNVFETWDLKPIGNRLVDYLFFKLAVLFTSFAQKGHFEVAVLAFYSVFSICLIWLSLYWMRNILKEKGILINRAFFVLIFAFLSVSPEVSMQPEHLSVLLVLMAIGLSLRSSPLFYILCGFVLALLFCVKLVTVLFSLVIYIILFVLGKKYYSHIKAIAFYQSFFTFLFIIFVKLFFPQNITDLRDAVLFQNIKFFRWMNLRNFFMNLHGAISDMPVFVVGLLCAVILFILCLRYKKHNLLLPLVGIWVFPLSVAILQGRGSTYHYGGAIIPSMICILICTSGMISQLKLPKWAIFLVCGLFSLVLIYPPVLALCKHFIDSKVNSRSFFTAAIVLFFSISISASLFVKSRKGLIKNSSHFIFSMGVAAFFVWLIFLSPLSKRWIEYNRVCQIDRAGWPVLDRKFGISSSGPVLFFTDGTPNYYILAPSYCRFFYPMPLNRSLRYPGITGLASYKENMDCVLSYSGKFIIDYPKWFPIEKFPEIEKKIKREYELVGWMLGGWLDAKIYRRITR